MLSFRNKLDCESRFRFILNFIGAVVFLKKKKEEKKYETKRKTVHIFSSNTIKPFITNVFLRVAL